MEERDGREQSEASPTDRVERLLRKYKVKLRDPLPLSLCVHIRECICGSGEFFGPISMDGITPLSTLSAVFPTVLE